MGRRQDGQEELERSQVSTHATWNPCPHCGITRTSSRSPNSARQMAHSASSSSSSSPSAAGAAPRAAAAAATASAYASFGSAFSSFFFSPLLAAVAVAVVAVAVVATPAPAPWCAWWWWCPPPSPGLLEGDAGAPSAPAPLLRRDRAQRATAASPTTQMSAQSRAAMITTTSEFTAAGGSAAGMPGMRFGFGMAPPPLSLLLWRRRREFDGRSIAGVGRAPVGEGRFRKNGAARGRKGRSRSWRLGWLMTEGASVRVKLSGREWAAGLPLSCGRKAHLTIMPFVFPAVQASYSTLFSYWRMEGGKIQLHFWS
uniref:Uncharacterized protein n=1 Tax=Zea mays TaxID=4577 RepID=A0A804R6L1_MAIZE